MIAPRIVIQRVRVRWTKASRGGEGARVRNSLPRQLVLPLEAFAAPVTLHRVDFDEANGFERTNFVGSFGSLVDWPDNELSLRIVDDKLEAKHLRRGGNSAVRDRPVPFVGGVEIADGQWSEFRANGRYVDYDISHWSYDATTYNVGLFSVVEVDRFTKQNPARRYVDIARL